MSFLSVLLLTLTLMYFTNISVIIIFLLVLLGAVFDPTGITARQTMTPQLAQLSRRDLGQINGYRGALENGADLLGPAIGGVLITVIGIVNTFFVNAASFLACTLIVYLSVPYKTTSLSKQAEVSFLLGVRYIIHNHQLRAMSLMGITSSFVLLPFLGLLLPVFITQNFDSPLWLGMCLSIFGEAATLGALLFRTLEGLFSRTTVYYGGFVLTSLSIMAFSFVASIHGIVVLALCAGLLLGAGNPLEQTVLQEVVPKNIAGQVFTSYGAIRFVTRPLGLICAGVLVESAGVPVVFTAAGDLLLVIVLIGWLMAPLSATTV